MATPLPSRRRPRDRGAFDAVLPLLVGALVLGLCAALILPAGAFFTRAFETHGHVEGRLRTLPERSTVYAADGSVIANLGLVDREIVRAYDDLPRVLKPAAEGGRLHHRGQVEVVSSLERDGRPVPRDLRWGVYVTFAADSDYVKRCFSEYGLATDETGNYAAMYKPYHLIGLELGISVAAAGLRREPTGAPTGFRGDVVAVAKRDLRAGEVLDGEGGYTVWGRLVPASEARAGDLLPIGLAHGVELTRDVAAGQPVRNGDVLVKEEHTAHRLRRELLGRG